jgi:hypothetical protein
VHIRSDMYSLAFTGLVMLSKQPAAIGFVFLAGCAPSPSQTRPAEWIDPEVWRSPHVLGVQHVSSVALAEGAAPLICELQANGFIRVVDRSSGTLLARAQVQAGQIVAIDAQHGVLLGGVPLSGPVPADHRYAIYLDINRPESGPPGPEKK